MASACISWCKLKLIQYKHILLRKVACAMRLKSSAFTKAAIIVLLLLPFLANAAEVLEVPPWARVVQHVYHFTTNSMTPLAETSFNAFGNAEAQIVLGNYATGWRSPDMALKVPQIAGKAGSSSGAWDLGGGTNAQIRFVIPVGDRAGEPDFVAYNVKLSVTATFYGMMVRSPSLSSPGHALHCLKKNTGFAFDDPYFGSWSNCVWEANLLSVVENQITLVLNADPTWGSIIDSVEIYALAEEEEELTRTGMGVPIEWYMANGIYPQQNEIWNDLDFYDLDGDGYLNWEEYYAGSDPNDADSLLKIIGINAREGWPVRLQWLGSRSGALFPYVVETIDDLRHPSWQPLGQIERVDGTNEWISIDLPWQSNRLFRVTTRGEQICN